ncbi:MAG: hypothetical protein ACYDAB_12150 [bacterium]
MHASVRRYEKVSNPREMGRHVKETFVPLISAVPGFVGYYFTDAGDGTMFSTSVFQDKTGVEESNKVAAEWVKKNPGTLPVAASVTTGEVIGHKVAGELVKAR